jgi:hypothetical protein
VTDDRDPSVIARLSAANPIPDEVVSEVVASNWSDELLARVLADPAAARNDAVSSRWARRERRRAVPGVALLGATVLIATLVAAPALGLPQALIRLFSSGDPAPPRTEHAFSSLDRGAPAALETGVIAGTARKALEVALPEGGRATLWVAPTAQGGFCEMLELVDAAQQPRGASGPGCDNRANVTGSGVTIPGPIGRKGIERGPVVVTGYSNIDSARRVVVRFEDNTETAIPLTWISEPIDAGLFVYGVRPANWEPGRLPSELRFENGAGDLVGKPHVLRLGPLSAGSPDS